MKRLAVVALAGMVLAGCGESDIDRARKLISAQLKDPSSAQYRNEWSKDGGWVCGEVNAKNSFGGYIGFRHYTVIWQDDGKHSASIEGEGESSLDRALCKKDG
jgi:hypothetical protein